MHHLLELPIKNFFLSLNRRIVLWSLFAVMHGVVANDLEEAAFRNVNAGARRIWEKQELTIAIDAPEQLTTIALTRLYVESDGLGIAAADEIYMYIVPVTFWEHG